MDFLKKSKLVLLNFLLLVFSWCRWFSKVVCFAKKNEKEEKLIPRYLDESLFGGITDVDVVMTEDISEQRRSEILEAATNIIEDLKVRRTAKSLQINLYDYIVKLLYEKKMISEDEIEFITEFKVVKDLQLNSLVQPNIKVSSTDPNNIESEVESEIFLSRNSDQIIKIF